VGFRAKARGALTDAYLGERHLRARRGLRSLGRRLGRRPRRLTFYHRVDSPRSHLLAQGLERFLDLYPFELELVIVPAPAADVDPEPKLRAEHDLLDARALAPHYGLAFPPEGQPPIDARVRMANAILLKGRPVREQLALAVEVSNALFAHDGATLHRLSDERGGLSGQEVRPKLEAGYARLRAAGHYQDGVLHYEGEWYLGLDRLHHLEARVRAEASFGFDPVFLPPALPVPPPIASGRVPLRFFFSFRSPYSYLALARLAPLLEARPIELSLAPVLPMVMRGLPVPRVKRSHIGWDAAREAQRHGVPFGRICDPLGPGVERCLAVAHAAEEEGKLLEFTLSAMRGIWAEAADLATDEELSRVALRGGLSQETVARALGARRYEAWLEGHREALLELGIWGVPSFEVGARAFWGQDRLPLVLAEVDRLAVAQAAE
jgi:2-hydroxychromene-2-carboxylate isomerase